MHRRARNAGLPEIADPFLARAGAQDLAHELDGLFAPLHACGVGREARIGSELLDLGDATEGAPQGVVCDAEDQRPVLGLEALVGTQRFVPGTGPLRLGTALPVRLEEIGEKRDRGVEERCLYARPLAGARAFEERREDTDQRMQAGRLVDGRERAAHRVAAALAGNRQHAAEGLQDHVVALAFAHRAGRTEARDAAIDHLWIDGAHRLVVDAKARRDAWAESLQRHVARLEQPCAHFAPLGRLEIERDAALAAVGAEEHRALPLAERRPHARVVTMLERLDLDHLRAHVGHVLGAKGSGQHLGKVEDLDAAKGLGHTGIRLMVIVHSGQCRSTFLSRTALP